MPKTMYIYMVVFLYSWTT